MWCASLLAWASIHVLGLLRLVSGFVFRSISRAMDELGTGPQCDPSALDQLKCYLTECIRKYGDEYQYSTDPRLLKIWILYVNFYQLWPHSFRVTGCSLAYFLQGLLWFMLFRQMQLMPSPRFTSSWKRNECSWSMHCSMNHMHCIYVLKGNCRRLTRCMRLVSPG